MSKQSKAHPEVVDVDSEPRLVKALDSGTYVNRMVSGSTPTIAKAGTIKVRAKVPLVEHQNGERKAYKPGDEFDISKERAAALGSAVETV